MQGLYMKAIAEDLGVQLKAEVTGSAAESIEIFSDSSSARAFSQRVGLGKQKHVSTRFLWLQEKTRSGEKAVKKIGTKYNTSDVLTKPLAGTTVRKHLTSLGCEFGVPYTAV
eukprot:5286946-Amphidinium_carterae.1